MYESPHPPHAAKASELPAHFLGFDLSSVDWTVWAVAIATIAVMVFILLKGRNRRGVGGTPAGDVSAASEARMLSETSWGPGDHSFSGSDAGHHGGTDAGGGHL